MALFFAQNRVLRFRPGIGIRHKSPLFGAVDAESRFGHELQAGQGNRVTAADANAKIRLVYFCQGVVQQDQSASGIAQLGLIDLSGTYGVHSGDPANGVIRGHRPGFLAKGRDISFDLVLFSANVLPQLLAVTLIDHYRPNLSTGESGFHFANFLSVVGLTEDGRARHKDIGARGNHLTDVIRGDTAINLDANLKATTIYHLF